jgi:undecaprenyl-diphosphatase
MPHISLIGVLHASMPVVSWEESLFFAINGLAGQEPARDQFFLYLGNLGTFYIPIALAVGYWIWVDWKEAVIGSVVLAGVIGLGDFAGGQLKWIVERVRPCRALSQAVTLDPSGCGALYSFPSNHAINTAAAAAFMFVLYPKSGWVSLPIVGLVGFARVYVGAHYVTDVIGGWIIGGLCGAGAAWLLVRWPRFSRNATIADLSTLPPSEP